MKQAHSTQSRSRGQFHESTHARGFACDVCRDGLSATLILGAFCLLFCWERRRPLRHRVEATGERAGRNLLMAGMTALALRVTERPLVSRISRYVTQRKVGVLKWLHLPNLIQPLPDAASRGTCRTELPPAARSAASIFQKLSTCPSRPGGARTLLRPNPFVKSIQALLAPILHPNQRTSPSCSSSTFFPRGTIFFFILSGIRHWHSYFMQNLHNLFSFIYKKFLNKISFVKD